ncbi:unnamed protein product [Effrenium voratum]|uniref:Uncharacterized protein n=1 Tax=Effrenium voratum TaxID=2562239 RepID=A0AA36MH54_9DINO|nr:unnamed protein product [Effrenium voratum]CAJ1452780.1 unnamed protein product [Effrenium voratum]
MPTPDTSGDFSRRSSILIFNEHRYFCAKPANALRTFCAGLIVQSHCTLCPDASGDDERIFLTSFTARVCAGWPLRKSHTQEAGSLRCRVPAFARPELQVVPYPASPQLPTCTP